MEKLKAILVDDELSSLQNLQQKLEGFCPDISVLAITQKTEEAIALIKEHKPDVIFLDIEMPRMSGFRMLEQLGEIEAEVIFTTAYNHYAIDAIRISAFDYLTKPIAIKELQQAVERLLLTRQKHTKERLEILRESMNSNKTQDDKIAVTTSEGIEFFSIKNVLYIEASSNYSIIHFINSKNLVVTRLLKDFEDMLVAYRFYRIHNSHLINLNYIQKYIRGYGGQVVLSDGTILDVARRKKDEFLKLIAG